MKTASETGRLAPYVPRALLARVARPLDVLGETVPCTMVFADVSGFTRLSERLARQGKEGAEQLVDMINSCFSALLAEAYGRGGSPVKRTRSRLRCRPNHFALASDHARAQRYALIAARRATERSAPAHAVQLYCRAIDAARASGVVEDPQALAEAWEQMGEELRRAAAARARIARGVTAVVRRPDRASAAVRSPGRGGRTQRGPDECRSVADAPGPRAPRAR